MILDIENKSGNMIAAEIIGAGYHPDSEIVRAAKQYDTNCEWATDNLELDGDRCSAYDEEEFTLFTVVEKLGFDKEHDTTSPPINYSAPYIKITIPNSQFIALVCELSHLRTDQWLDNEEDEDGNRTEEFQDAINEAIDNATATLAAHGITDAGI